MNKFFVVLILLSALPFGSNRAWAWSLFSIFIAVFGLFFFIKSLFLKSQFKTSAAVVVSGVLFCVPLIVCLVQTVNFINLDWVHPFWYSVNQLLSTSANYTISLLPYQTLTGLMRLISYGLVFMISFYLNKNSKNVDITFKIIAYIGFAYASYGLIIHFGGFNTILWFDKWSYLDLLTSTFVNRNSYATFAGLSFLACMPLIFEGVYYSFKYGVKTNYGRQFFVENMVAKGWQPLLLVTVIFTALLLTQSRGGILSTLLAVFVFTLLLLISRKIKLNSIIILLIGLIGLTSSLVFYQGGEKLVERLDKITLDDKNDRLVLYDIIAKANHDNSWLGIGYNSFEKTFRLYRNESIVSYFDKAHNTFLENIFELGYLPAYSLFLSIFILAIICLTGVFNRRKNWIYPAIGFSSTVLVATHSLVDFSLQIPAVAYLYALILGGAVAQAFSTKNSF